MVQISSPVNSIGVLSDTHIPARARRISPRIFEQLAGVQLILHAGDLVEEQVLKSLASIAPVVAVAGNMDPPELSRSLGRRKLVCTGAVRIGLVHGDGHLGTTVDRARAAFSEHQPQVIVFGHSHQSFNHEQDGVLMFNPGSATDPRRARRPSCGILKIKDGAVQGKILFI